jgi:hypothetical protein
MATQQRALYAAQIGGGGGGYKEIVLGGRGCKPIRNIQNISSSQVAAGEEVLYMQLHASKKFRKQPFPTVYELVSIL